MEERQGLLEDLRSQRQSFQAVAAQTPISENKKRPAMSPPEGPEKNVLKQANGSFTVATVRGKRQRTGDNPQVEKKKKKKLEEGAWDEGVTVVPAGPSTRTPNLGPGTKPTTAAKDERRPRRKQRPETVLINPGESRSFGEVLRALRLGLHLEELGLRVKAVRTARKGGLLIEFEGSVKDRSALGNKITDVAGGDVEVHHLVPTATLVIDGMDSATTVEEVKAALAETIGSVGAFIGAGLGAAAALETLGKAKVGLLVRRIRRWERLDRCYRCHGLGHLAGSCRVGEDRSGCCWRCEQYHSVSGPNWYCDPTGTAAVWVPDRSRLSVRNSGSRDGIVWVVTPAVTFVSCYFTPSEPIADFRKKVDNLERVVRHLEGEIVIGAFASSEAST
ncbi:Protein of unknown function [Cotesia congregata]|uniref:CCHC-type domain-containing protein n=1 Tax=Cotesia congregata TaxID=51543 RepID=A0A8J2H6G7_COTCN|nr:Protein of unknown function [Cotesia congregata]